MREATRSLRRKAPLGRERIVTAALELIGHEGPEAFSTRSLGRALHCEAMSIYRVFPGKQHLTDALVDRVIGEFEFAGERLPALERLRRACRAYRTMAHRHPNRFPVVAVHRLDAETGVSFIERLLSIPARRRGRAPTTDGA